jgi:integrase
LRPQRSRPQHCPCHPKTLAFGSQRPRGDLIKRTATAANAPVWRHSRPMQGASPYVFVTEARTPVTTAWFLRMVQRSGRATMLSLPVHPHMLRHSIGTSLPMIALTCGRWRTTSRIAICNRRLGILRWRRIGLRNSGRTSDVDRRIPQPIRGLGGLAPFIHQSSQVTRNHVA